MTPLSGALRAIGGVRLLAGGLLVLQLVWVFAVPPFRGVDEFDHAYRAASVADGQWAPEPAAATRGTGAWLDVPAALVRAAGPECSALPYTRAHDCVGTAVDDDTIRVASGAGRYHPLYYALVGAPAVAFDGASSLYVMRFASVLLCWAFFCLALVATRCWARSRWPYVALAVATTPVVVYSTVLPAPNGLEITSALALWSALLGLAVRRDPGTDARLLGIATTAAATLVTLRSFGPVWCALVLLTVLVAVPVSRSRVRKIMAGRRGRLAVLVVLAATVASLAWIRSMGSLVVGKDPAPLDTLTKLGTTARELVLWTLQSIAAFPTRNEQTHSVVYVLFGLLFGALVGSAFRVGSRRGRTALLVAAASSALVPAAVTFATLESYGTAWQGRYTLPYAVGIALIAGFLLDEAAPRCRADVLVGGGLCFVVAQVTGPLLVTVRERATSLGVDDGAWILLPPALLGVVAVLGSGLLWLGAVSVRVDDRAGRVRQHPEPAPEEVFDDRSDRPGVAVGARR